MGGRRAGVGRDIWLRERQLRSGPADLTDNHFAGPDGGLD
jgi:hypothetical protein